MNILQISRGQAKISLTNKAGGFEEYIFNLSKYLSEMRHKVIILDRQYSKQDRNPEQSSNLQIMRLKAGRINLERFKRLPRFIHFIVHEFNNVLYSYKVARYLRSRSNTFDAIIVHTPLPGIVLVTLNRGICKKMFYACHSALWSVDSNQLGPIKKLMLSLESYLIKRINKTIVPGEELKAKIMSRAKIGSDKIALIEEGVDTDFFKPDVDAENIKQKYKLQGKFTILFVGRLSKVKGIEYLLKAANIIVNDFGNKNALFLLVGPLQSAGGIDEPIRLEDVNDFINQHKLEENIMPTGLVSLEDLRSLYVACDVFILPSLSEFFPATIREAAASGKPIIATRVGGIPSQIKDGWNGFLIDPENERQLAEKIEYLINHPEERRQVGINSRKYAEEELQWRKVAEKYLIAFQS